MEFTRPGRGIGSLAESAVTEDTYLATGLLIGNLILRGRMGGEGFADGQPTAHVEADFIYLLYGG